MPRISKRRSALRAGRGRHKSRAGLGTGAPRQGLAASCVSTKEASVGLEETGRFVVRTHPVSESARLKRPCRGCGLSGAVHPQLALGATLSCPCRGVRRFSRRCFVVWGRDKSRAGLGTGARHAKGRRQVASRPKRRRWGAKRPTVSSSALTWCRRAHGSNAPAGAVDCRGRFTPSLRWGLLSPAPAGA